LLPLDKRLIHQNAWGMRNPEIMQQIILLIEDRNSVEAFKIRLERLFPECEVEVVIRQPQRREKELFGTRDREQSTMPGRRR
jgi:hypothetical protein